MPDIDVVDRMEGDGLGRQADADTTSHRPHLTIVPPTTDLIEAPGSLHKPPEDAEPLMYSDPRYMEILDEIRSSWQKTYPHFYARGQSVEDVGSFTMKMDAEREFRRRHPESARDYDNKNLPTRP